MSRGVIWLFYKSFTTGIGLLLGLLLQPAALLAHLFGFRRVTVATKFIGHLASEPDCLIKLAQLGLWPTKRWFLTAPLKKTANICLLNYWQQYFIIVSNPVMVYLLRWASIYGLMKLDVTDFVLTHTKAALYYEVNRLWEGRSALLSLSKEHRQEGYHLLSELGLPVDTWFVCVHVRENGFVSETEWLHSYRNSDIDHYREAIEKITSQGGWVVRMGDLSMKKIPNLPNVIDYAHLPEKSDWMDVFLCAECRFFLGDTSGLFLVSTVFGVPCALANMTPLGAQAYTAADIYIPKLYRDQKTEKYLHFPDLFRSSISNFRFSHLYTNLGIEIEQNVSEDILALVEEMLLILDNEWFESTSDKQLQLNYKKMFNLKHHGHKSASRISPRFLHKNKKLLFN